ncbi:TBC1 domain member 7 [Bulinus truncatus]|nr:TBC1 domain member 7 [Bulinus truncatus]
MPSHCCVPGCRGNYPATSNETYEKVSVFQFPQDQAMKEEMDTKRPDGTILSVPRDRPKLTADAYHQPFHTLHRICLKNLLSVQLYVRLKRAAARCMMMRLSNTWVANDKMMDFSDLWINYNISLRMPTRSELDRKVDEYIHAAGSSLQDLCDMVTGLGDDYEDDVKSPFKVKLTEHSNAAYLKEKAAILQPNEKVVILLLDEIYVNSKITYKGGSIVGGTGWAIIILMLYPIHCRPIGMLRQDELMMSSLYAFLICSAFTAELTSYSLFILKLIKMAAAGTRSKTEVYLLGLTSTELTGKLPSFCIGSHIARKMLMIKHYFDIIESIYHHLISSYDGTISGLSHNSTIKMMDQERNFRTHYYEKVGFRAVEEKKSIEILLKEQPIKKEKLIQFCLRYGVPAMYRIYVWKIILGILPTNQASQEYVWYHRGEQVKELEKAGRLLAPECTDGSLEHKVLRLKLIDEGCLPLKNKFLDTDPSHSNFLSIVQATSSFVSSDVDLFWISTRFYKHIQDSLSATIGQFSENILQCLKKEDQNQKLYQHLFEHQVLSVLPMREWLYTCYANILPENALERIWDRVIGESSTILIYVAVSIFLVLRRPLLALQSSVEMVNYLSKIPEDCGDRIVNEALDLLHKNAGAEAISIFTSITNLSVIQTGIWQEERGYLVWLKESECLGGSADGLVKP